MRPVHTMRVARDLGEGRQPAFGALLGHTQVAGEHLLLLDGVKQDAQGVGSTVGVPQPVIGVEGNTLIIMHLLIKATPVATIFGEAYHTLVGAVEGGVEDTALIGRPPFDLYFIQRLRPLIASVLSHQIDFEGLDLLLDIALGLLDTDVGDAIAQADLWLSEAKRQGLASSYPLSCEGTPRE